MKDLQKRLDRINYIKTKYAAEGKSIPIDECEDLLEQEQAALAELYLARFGERSYEKRMFKSMGKPKVRDFVESGLDHDENTVVLTNMDAKLAELRKNGLKEGEKPITDKEDIKDQRTYEIYMLSTGGEAIDHYLTILPHELRHLFGASGNSDLKGFGAIAEGKTESDTRLICKELGIPYFLNRNYSKEVDFVRRLEGIVGKDTVDEYVTFKSREFSKMMDDYKESPDKKEAVFNYIQLREGNSIKKAVALSGTTTISEKDLENLKKVSNYLKKVHPLQLTDELLENNSELKEILNTMPADLQEAIRRVIAEKRTKMENVKGVLGEDFQAIEEQYAQIDTNRNNYLSTNIVSKLNHGQLQEFCDFVNDFNDEHNKKMTDKERKESLSNAGIVKMSEEPGVMDEKPNVKEIFMYVKKERAVSEKEEQNL